MKKKESEVVGIVYRLLGRALEVEIDTEKDELIKAARVMINSL